MTDNKPAISVIVSVYNAEVTMTRCLESLVYQTLENIEIIIIDKASTDRSKEIAQFYQTNFPDKIRLFERPYSVNLAAAYNFAAPQARADYLAFADADDWYELNAMEVIYKEICERSVDIIHYPWNVLDSNGRQIRVERHPPEETIEAQLLSKVMCAYWSRVVRKSLFCKYLPIPEWDGVDVNYLPILITNASSIATINTPLYNYVIGTGISNNTLSRSMITLINGWNHLLTHCNSNYMDYIIPFIARRVELSTRKFWIYKWQYIEWLKTHKDQFLNSTLLKEDFDLYNKIEKLAQTEIPLIPLVVYINGFGEKDLRTRIQEIQNVAFCLGEGRIVVLNEETCDLNNDVRLQQAYQGGRYEYLGHYFAVKNVYQTGGFYVGDQIRFTATFAPVLDKPSVFSYITANTFSSEIWGARPGNEVIKELLNTYETPDFYEDRFYPLSERIKNILVARFDVPLNGKQLTKEDALFVADARMFVLNDKNYPFVCEHVFSAQIDQDGYKVIPLDIAVPTNLTVDKKIMQLTWERNELKGKLSEIYNSDSWKLIKRLKKFANSPIGRPFKWIFKKLLRVYRKIKYDM